MEDLTAFQRNALYVIDGLDEPHGLAIKEELEANHEKEEWSYLDLNEC